MDIVIISDFCRGFNSNKSRFCYLATMLNKKHDVEIITSDFIHGTKRYYSEIPQNPICKITMLHEPSYPTNVCLKRFYSHFVWGENVKVYLEKRKKPDVIYCAIPTLRAASETAKYCEKNKIRFIIDIQDLWPEAFEMVFHIPIISKVIFKPFHFIANKAYKQADVVCAVSDTYVERVLSVNKKCKKGYCVFLGTKLEDFDSNVKSFHIENINVKLPQKREENLWLGYCGTLGSSYDLICVFEALEIVKEKGVEPPTFIVMGDGPRREEFEQYAMQKGIDVVFTGFLPYTQMCGLLCMCDITVNPITHGAAQSIINKHADYAASGLPVLSTQECVEYRNLVDEYHMGFNCNNNDAEDLAEKMEMLIRDKILREKMGKNARKCAEEKFDRRITYRKLESIIVNNYE